MSNFLRLLFVSPSGELIGLIRPYFAYPLIVTFALNTIILIIIFSIIREDEKQEADRTIAALNIQRLEAQKTDANPTASAAFFI